MHLHLHFIRGNRILERSGNLNKITEQVEVSVLKPQLFKCKLCLLCHNLYVFNQ